MKDKSKYTKHEKTRIISARALQIFQGSPVLVDVPRGVTKPVDIALLEWEAGVIPIDIKEAKKEEKKKEDAG
jgi:DNA-directed RNA polymerase subunit K